MGYPTTQPMERTVVQIRSRTIAITAYELPWSLYALDLSAFISALRNDGEETMYLLYLCRSCANDGKGELKHRKGGRDES